MQESVSSVEYHLISSLSGHTKLSLIPLLFRHLISHQPPLQYNFSKKPDFSQFYDTQMACF